MVTMIYISLSLFLSTEDILFVFGANGFQSHALFTDNHHNKSHIAMNVKTDVLSALLSDLSLSFCLMRNTGVGHNVL